MSLDDGLIGGGAAPQSGAGDLIKDTTTEAFVADVIEASKEQPVLVDFWAPWCGPCKTLTPILESAVLAAKGAVKLVKMNIDEHPQIAGQLGVQSIPAVFAFKNGRPADGFMGALPEGQVKAFIDRLLGDAAPGADLAQILDAADAAAVDGKLDDAGGAYSAVLREEPENLRAIAGLTQVFVAKDDLDNARKVFAMVPEGAAGDAAIAGARAALELAEKADELGEAGELMARVEASPDDHQARFDLAMALNARGEKLEAAKALIEIVRRDREWNEDGARKQLLQFFEAWGPKDPATQEGRRLLSAVLFA